MSDQITFAAKITAEGRRLKGSVTLTGARTFRDGEWVEVDPKALLKADASNVFATIDHDMARMVGRSKNGTLSLSRTEDGIAFETAELPNTTYANDALELARGGYYGGSSFTVEGHRSKFSVNPEDGIRVRTINSIKRLVDVSIVTDPAFATSTAAAFSKENPMGKPVMEDTDEQPEAPPVAKFTEQPKPVDEWAAFAANLTTADIETQVDSLLASGNLKGEILDRIEGFNRVLGQRKLDEAKEQARAATAVAVNNARKGIIPVAPASSELFASRDYEEGFKQYLRTGNGRHMEQFAQAVAGDGSEGGYTVPDGFLAKISERLVAFGGIAGVSDELVTSSGESLRWPTNDDTANSAAIAAEGVAGTAGADLTFGSIELGAFSYDANGTGNAALKVSLELLQDAAFDIAGLVGRKLGERIGRKQAVDLATGTGQSQPFGLLTKAADAMTATVVSLAAPEHILQVDSAYRDGGNCRWIMSDTSLAKVWQSQTTTNQPLFIPGGSDIIGKPGGQLYGYPITIDAAAGNLVAFGDFKRGYIVRRVRGVQVLVDPYTAQGTRQIAYHAWARMDADVQDSYAYSVSTWASVSADT